MNKSYRSIWNEALGAWVAASELTSGRGKKSSSRVLAVAAIALVAAGQVGAGGLDGGTANAGGPGAAQLAYGPGASTMALAPGNNAIAIGDQVVIADPTAFDAIAIGTQLSNSGQSAILMGNNFVQLDNASDRSVVFAPDGAAYGGTAGAYAQPVTNSADTFFYGSQRALNKVTNSPGAVAIGGSVINGIDGVAIGTSSLSGFESVALGRGASAADNLGVAIGSGTLARGQAISIGAGAGAGATVAHNLAVGISAGANSASNTSTAIGTAAGMNGTGAGALAVGYQTGQDVSGLINSAFGANAGSKVTGDNNLALGYNAGSGITANNTISIGHTATAKANDAIAIGLNAQANGEQSISIGTGNIVNGKNSGAFGDPSIINGANSYSVGNNNTLATNDTFVLGNNVTATTKNGVVLGSSSASTRGAIAAVVNPLLVAGQTSSAYVNPTTVTSVGEVSVGATGAERQITHVAGGTQDTDAVNVGQIRPLVAAVNGGGIKYFHANSADVDSQAIGLDSVAIGPQAKAGNQNAFAAGMKASAQGKNSTAVGINSVAMGEGDLYIGNEAGVGGQASSRDNAGFGSSAGQRVNGGANMAVGARTGTDVIGSGNSAFGAEAGNFVVGDANVAIGYRAGQNIGAVGAQIDNTVAIGRSSRASQNDAIAIGNGAQATGKQSISIGTGNVVSGNNSGAFGDPSIINGASSYSVGNGNTVATNDTFVLGNNVTATTINGVVLGSNSASARGAITAVANPLLMAGQPSTGNNNPATITSVGEVSVGAAGAERQITNVAGGTLDTDAVNVGQIKPLVAAVSGGGIKYFHANSTAPDSQAIGLDSVAIGPQAVAGKQNSLAAGMGATAQGTNSTAIGVGSVAMGQGDLYIGNGAGVGGQASSRDNSGFGSFAGQRVNGGVNIAAGARTGNDVTGSANSAFGAEAGNSVLGDSNSAVGYTAGQAVDGDSNAAFGTSAGSKVFGNRNIAIGNAAGQNVGTAAAPVDDTVSIGTSSSAKYQDSVALGSKSVTGATLAALTATAAYNPGTAVLAGVTPVGEVSIGSAGAERRITNVAAGGAPTDAVNVSQLQSLTNTVTANKIKYFSVQGSGSGNANNEGATGLQAMAVGEAAEAAGNLAVAMGTFANAGGPGGVALGSNSTAAADGSTAVGYGSYAGARGSTALGQGAAASFLDSVAVGHDTQDSAENSVLVGARAGGAANATALGYQAKANIVGSVALGSDSVASTASGIAGYVPPPGDAAQIAAINATTGTRGVVSVGDAANGIFRQITGVAAGTADSDAVNVAQLKAVNATIAVASNKWITGSQTTSYVAPVASGTESTAVGSGASVSANNSVAVGTGATATTANSVALGNSSTTGTAVATPSVTIRGDTYNFAGAAPVGVVSVGSAGQERQITNVAAGQISATSTDAINGSQLYATNQAINNIAIGGAGIKYFHANSAAADSNAAGAESVAIGPQAVSQGAGSIAVGNSSVATAANGVALGAGSTADRAGMAGGTELFSNTAVGSTQGAVSVGSAGNERQITNVAGGTQATDAVNVRQLQAVQAGGVKYDTNADGSINYNSVTLGNNTGPTTIHNVAPGVAGNDAVNVNQLNQASAASAAYTDSRVNQLRGDIKGAAKDASAGTAGAMAMAGMPQAYIPGKSMLAAGVAGYDGQAALAIGVSKLSDNGRWIVKFSGSANSRGKVGVSAGAGFHW